MERILIVYITCSDAAEAERIGKALLEARHVACVNIFSSVHSWYLWPPRTGKQEEAREVVLLVKTVEEKWKEVEEMVCKLHSYTNPCIIGIPIRFVSSSYGEWIKEEVLGGKG